jgi:hypothetical protein
MVQAALLDQVPDRVSRWVWGERPLWRCRAVGGYPDLHGISAGQRVVQLTKGVERGARIVDRDPAR